MTPRERKAALLLAGRTQLDVAREAGVSTGLVSMVLNNKHRHDRVEAVIAQFVARPRSDVFAVAPGLPRRVLAAGAAR